MQWILGERVPPPLGVQSQRQKKTKMYLNDSIFSGGFGGSVGNMPATPIWTLSPTADKHSPSPSGDTIPGSGQWTRQRVNNSSVCLKVDKTNWIPFMLVAFCHSSCPFLSHICIKLIFKICSCTLHSGTSPEPKIYKLVKPHMHPFKLISF